MAEKTAPVTVAISRCVSPGAESRFEAWADRISEAAATFPGHLGSGHLRSPGTGCEHTIVYRFDSAEHLNAWQESDIRMRYIEESRELVQGEPRIEMVTGLEFWFSDPSRAGEARPKVWKQALLTWVGLYPTALLVAYTVGVLTASWPQPARSAVTTAVTVVLMTWIVMPQITRLFRKWLRPKAV
ncbi:MAG: antibiotic biosynthesis monooxygenase [Actinobacteria bacterium HGW-Actinobacteria-6]|jgi:hypothetical protein|nr:MAG: antibiotic biosynthesis monooxygenase [Actinobacteria bacterium HGW-Actinobacteria-6]